MKRIIPYLSILLTAVSCYRDLGNYDYTQINEIEISTEAYTFTIPTGDQVNTVTITPTVTQTLKEGSDNLSYQWKRQVSGIEWEVVGDGPTYDLQVTSADVSVINLIFAVTDNDLGITTYEEIAVNPVFALSQTWFLLQNVDGKAVLGTVDGEGSGRGVSPDISAQVTSLSLTGSPTGLGINPFRRANPPFVVASYEILLGVFTTAQPYILDGSTLQEHSLNYYRLLYGKTVSGDRSFAPQVMKGQRNGFAIIDDGRLWYSVPDEYSLMYAVDLDDELGAADAYKAEDLCHYTTAQNLLLYDGQGHRFLYYSNADLGLGYYDRGTIVEGGSAEYEEYLTGTSNNRTDIVRIGEGSLPNVFNPDNIPSGFVIDDMSLSTGDQLTNIMATGHIGNTLYIYEFCMPAIIGSENQPYCSNAWTIPVSSDLSAYTDRVPVTTSAYFTRRVFFAAGNTVYSVDLGMDSASPVAIWSSSVPTDVITGLKFKSDYEDIAYPNPSNRNEYLYKGITHHLGAVVRHTDNSCDLVEFNLTAAGEIERDSSGNRSIQVFEGFTDVVDFVFSFRDIVNN